MNIPFENMNIVRPKLNIKHTNKVIKHSCVMRRVYYCQVQQKRIILALINKRTNFVAVMSIETIGIPDTLPFGLVPTMNKMGYMTSQLDLFSNEFVQYSATQTHPALEVGAAYGVATIEALKKGGKMVANDLDSRHLKILYDSLPKKLKHNCSLLPGQFPDETKIEPSSISCILICRVLHFMDGEQIARALTESYNILIPKGKLFIVAETPYLKNWESFIPVYEKRQKEGMKFPGWVETKKYSTHYTENLPEYMNLLDKNILKEVLHEAGFVIEKVDYIDRHYFPDTVRYDGRESVGIIAVKP